MSFFLLQNIKKKLKKSVINNFEVDFVSFVEKSTKITSNYNLCLNFVIRKLFFNFLLFFSKKLCNKKNKSKILVFFFKFYRYYNRFFLKNKILFYKKYFLKKNNNIFYFNHFFLSKKRIRLKPCLKRLKVKRIEFYKKNIWKKNKKFRKKNLLIFNKIFFKKYNFTRFRPFIVDSILFAFNIKKHKYRRKWKKKMEKLLSKKYYYLFVHKLNIFSKPRKKRYKKKMISFNFNHKSRARFFFNRKFFKTWKKKTWRKVYYSRKKRRIWKRSFFFNFNATCFDSLYFLKKKKVKNFRAFIISKYLKDFGLKLKKKHYYDKKFMLKFFSRKKFFRRYKNILYFFRWKQKIFNFHFSIFLNKFKNIKKILFGAIWFKLIYNKIFWKKRKNAKLFLLFYYVNFFFKKSFLFFNSFFKYKFYFSKYSKIKKILRKRFKSKRFTVYNKKKRRFIIKKKIKKKIVRLFLILLLFRVMKKHKRSQKFFLFKNAFFSNIFRRLRLSLLMTIFFGNKPFYFKDNNFLNDTFFLKKHLKTVLLLERKKNN